MVGPRIIPNPLQLLTAIQVVSLVLFDLFCTRLLKRNPHPRQVFECRSQWLAPGPLSELNGVAGNPA